MLIEGQIATQPGGVRTFAAFRRRLTEKSLKNYDIYFEALDSARFPGEAHQERTARYLGERYAQNPPDLLVANGRQSLTLLTRHRDLIAPNVPIVYCCTTPAAADALNLPSDAVGVVAEYNWSKTLALAERLQPRAQNLVLISGASETDRLWEIDARNAITSHLKRYHVRYLAGLPHDDLLQEVSRVSSDTIVLMTVVFADRTGRRYVPEDVAKDVAATSAAPVYTAVPPLFDSGILGGYMDSFEAQGAAAADLALEIFAGKNPATLPRQTKPSHTYQVDARALERWGLPESALPSGSEVRYRSQTFWNQYRWHVSATFALVLFQAGMISWLLFERRRRSIAEMEASGRRREVIHLNRVATATVLSSSLAHELSQPLGAILMNAEAARLMLKTTPPDLSEMDEILADVIRDNQRATEIVHSQKSFLKKDSSSGLQVFDLCDAVQEVVGIAASEAAKRSVALSADRSSEALLVRADRIQMQQVMLNLVMNGMDALEVRVPAARRLSIHASRCTASSVEVIVSDSGLGIPEGKLRNIFEPFFTTKPQGTGLGLPIARTIIETHGGTIWAENRVAGGAAFHFTLPLAAANPA